MLCMVLAESSLELVPAGLCGHPSVVSHASRMQKKPSGMLLDNSWHFAAMRGMENELKRGRPDLVHAAVLAATATPLYRQGMVRLFVHTLDDHVIEFGNNVRLPRSYHRFAGLMEGLFRGEPGAARDGLLDMRQETFPELVDKLRPSGIVGLSRVGAQSSFEELAGRLDEDACVVVGGFQKGHFSKPVLDRMDRTYSVGAASHDAHMVVSRLLYEYEKTIFI